jgi:hypothetical protein
MLVQYVFEIFYLALFAVIISFIILFYVFSRKPPKGTGSDTEFNQEAMDHKRAPPPGGPIPTRLTLNVVWRETSETGFTFF